MKVALVHDYLNEFGGAERVLLALSEIWPKAPIFTAFYRKGSPAYERFKDKKIITSWAQKVPFFSSRLYSPLRFLAPLIWASFARQLADYDVVITSASWYVTKGFKKARVNGSMGPSFAKASEGKQRVESKTIEICYCHTPPRYLYGYKTSVDWQKYWPVKVYASIVNHFLRVYDFEAAQRVDYFIANSREVQSRIKKFYRRDSVVIYPPIDVNRFSLIVDRESRKKAISDKRLVNNGYFLVVSRLVASKNVDIAVQVCAKLGLPLKVVGSGRELENLKKLAKTLSIPNDRHSGDDPANAGEDTRIDSGQARMTKLGTVEFLNDVTDSELICLYQNCRAVIFPASQEDFGLVPVEAMAAGKPVIANAQGGVLESVIDASADSTGSLQAGSAQVGQRKGHCTGVYFDPATPGSLTLAINNFLDLEKKGYFDPKFIQAHAQKFSKERFKKEISEFVESKLK